MKKLKLFPKTFLYTLGLTLFILLTAHGLFILFTSAAALDLALKPGYGETVYKTTFNVLPFITQTLLKALPISLAACLLVAAVCSYLYSKVITSPIVRICEVTKRMERMEQTAGCGIGSQDEIGALASHINHLYKTLLSVIEDLEREKQLLKESEKSKTDFLRAASHELKTPVTALSAMLENMLLGVGKYKEYEAVLPECKEMTDRLAAMIHDILEASKTEVLANSEQPAETELSGLLLSLCAPYQLIAAARGSVFNLNLCGGFRAVLPSRLFGRAAANILANAAAYTPAGKTISVYFSEMKIVIENECLPIPSEALPRLSEAFYRPDFARSRGEGGNGLGLYIAGRLFKSMDIPYSFLPMENPQGMRFTIDLSKQASP